MNIIATTCQENTEPDGRIQTADDKIRPAPPEIVHKMRSSLSVIRGLSELMAHSQFKDTLLDYEEMAAMIVSNVTKVEQQLSELVAACRSDPE